MSFRNPNNCSRYEYISYDLITPIVAPVANQAQRKNGYKFVADGRGEHTPNDLYNAYLEVDFKVCNQDNSNYAANSEITTTNGSHSFIQQIKASYNGINVLDTQNINHCVSVKNLLDLSDTYANRVGASMFNHIDTNTGAVSTEFDQIPTVAAGGAFPATRPAKNNYNEGYAKRRLLTDSSATVNTIIPLNRYSFFESFKNQICPPGKLELDITFESDANVLFRANATADGKFVISKLTLWIPKIVFTPAGNKLYLDSYSNNRTWSYLKEQLMFHTTQERVSTFRISTSIRKLKHVFIWFLNNTKLNDQEENMYVYNTFNIANGRTITSAQLEISNGVYYPQQRFDPTNELTRCYHALMEYNKSYNDMLLGSVITKENFEKLYGIIYFDLRNQDQTMGNDTKLELKYTLSGATNAQYTVFSMVLNEESVSVDIVGGKPVLRV